MYPSKNIVENAVNSKDHTTLVAAVKAAGLVETLLKPENKAMLTGILTYHVAAANWTPKNWPIVSRLVMAPPTTHRSRRQALDNDERQAHRPQG